MLGSICLDGNNELAWRSLEGPLHVYSQVDVSSLIGVERVRVVASGEGHAVAVLVCHEEHVDVGCVQRELKGDRSVLLPQ